ncbi:MAG: hypothetical protein HYU41_26855 [Candidatus Rokubacteria bacterium]|nr:hypothetical protein [Candidatus Rokubacteria bacterium]
MTVVVALAIVLGVLVALDVRLAGDAHHVPGLGAIIGLIGAGLLVVVARLLATCGLQIGEPRDD